MMCLCRRRWNFRTISRETFSFIFSSFHFSPTLLNLFRERGPTMNDKAEFTTRISGLKLAPGSFWNLVRLLVRPARLFIFAIKFDAYVGPGNSTGFIVTAAPSALIVINFVISSYPDPSWLEINCWHYDDVNGYLALFHTNNISRKWNFLLRTCDN